MKSRLLIVSLAGLAACGDSGASGTPNATDAAFDVEGEVSDSGPDAVGGADGGDDADDAVADAPDAPDAPDATADVDPDTVDAAADDVFDARDAAVDADVIDATSDSEVNTTDVVADADLDAADTSTGDATDAGDLDASDAVADADACVDSDLDGVCDSEDICSSGDDGDDLDADGVPDACDICPLDAPDDSDTDGVCDSSDVCAWGDDGADIDADGVPDECDECPVDAPDDSDLDGVCDSLDVCPAGSDIVDTDGDSVVDGCDACPVDNPDDLDGDGACGDRFAACRDLLVVGPTWPNAERDVELTGAIEWGQTHVVAEDESRLAPTMIQGRDTLVLFTPDELVADSADLLIAAIDDGSLVGVLPMAPPDELPAALEQSLTDVALEPYSETAWSAVVPAAWVRNGLTLRIAYVDDADRHVRDEVIAGFGAPHRFTISRTHVVLFGEPDFDASTTDARKLAADYFASVPYAELRVVDSLPWRLDQVVVPTSTGPQLVDSEAARTAVASDADHWSILKHQVALRLSLANTGRGLVLTGQSEGDSSPYSFGTSVAMGWFRAADGNYVDIDDAPWAAGWTGWTAMWADECGNGFIHEVGHSFSLAHFTTGTAASWGISAEYPQDGTNISSHPWGFDTARRVFRTWYRVDASGPVSDGAGGWVGKRDPMNGGEAPNAVTCFPQYTAYHARKIQQWSQSSPTLATIDHVAGAWLWNVAANRYVSATIDGRFQHPIATDVPVLTMIGTLAANDAASQTYPEIRFVSGNVFDLPDPFTPGLDAAFNGARWYLEIEYADGSRDYALIARGAISDSSLYLYSLNLDARLSPVVVRLYRATSGYPAIDREASVLVHSRAIGDETPLPPVVTMGGGQLGAGAMRLGMLCEEPYNCESRDDEVRWQVGAAQLTFSAGDAPAYSTCMAAGSATVLEIPVVDEAGNHATVTAYAQRVVSGGDTEVRVALDDSTPWVTGADVVQSLRVWLPYAENSALAVGRWTNEAPFSVNVFADGVGLGAVPISVDLEVLERTAVDLATTWRSTPIATVGTSMYFVVRDAEVGPTTRVWWDDGIAGPTILHVPVVDSVTGELTTLQLDAQREECSGARADFNAGRGASTCNHWAILGVSATGNSALVAGRTYTTPPSAPLVFEGRQWHDPGARRLLATFALDLTYTR